MADPVKQPPERGEPPPPPPLYPAAAGRNPPGHLAAHLPKPVVAFTAIGTVLSELVGYWKVYRTDRGDQPQAAAGAALAARSVAVQSWRCAGPFVRWPSGAE